MDKFAEALIELVKQGAPLAKWALVGHYTLEALSYVLTAGCVLIVAALIYKLIRHGQRIIEQNKKAPRE